MSDIELNLSENNLSLPGKGKVETAPRGDRE